MKRTILVGGFVLFVIVLVSMGYLFSPSRRADADAIATLGFTDKQSVDLMTKQKLMAESDNWHLRDLRKKVKVDRRLSDEDFRWLMNLGHKPSWDAPFVRTMALEVISNTKFQTSDQKTLLRDEALPWMQSGAFLDRDNAMVAMWIVKDPTTIPRILPLLSDPNMMVRKKARWALQSMGYKFPEGDAPQ